jgi:hypothetical protein
MGVGRIGTQEERGRSAQTRRNQRGMEAQEHWVALPVNRNPCNVMFTTGDAWLPTMLMRVFSFVTANSVAEEGGCPSELFAT